jgi:hypothetical protein
MLILRVDNCQRNKRESECPCKSNQFCFHLVFSFLLCGRDQRTLV